jgi:hypothetical protein
MDSDDLKAAYALIARPADWCQGVLFVLPSEDRPHYQLCSTGALQHVLYAAGVRIKKDYAGLLRYQRLKNYLERALVQMGITTSYSVEHFNDHHSHRCVVEMWTRAIAIALDDEAANAEKREVIYGMVAVGAPGGGHCAGDGGGVHGLPGLYPVGHV